MRVSTRVQSCKQIMLDSLQGGCILEIVKLPLSRQRPHEEFLLFLLALSTIRRVAGGYLQSFGS